MPMPALLVTTTSSIPGYTVRHCLGLVSAEACLAPDELGDLGAFIKRVDGGRHPLFERMVRKARNEAMAALEGQARELGANAILGTQSQLSHLTDLGLLMISLIGTAVFCEPDQAAD